jgi:hypothetical protein
MAEKDKNSDEKPVTKHFRFTYLFYFLRKELV